MIENLELAREFEAHRARPRAIAAGGAGIVAWQSRRTFAPIAMANVRLDIPMP